MKTFALLFLLLSSHNFIFSQHKFEKSGVIITTNSIEVRDKNSTEFGWIFEIAQIENITKTKKKISFHVDMYYDGICSNCGNKEYQFSFNSIWFSESGCIQSCMVCSFRSNTVPGLGYTADCDRADWGRQSPMI